MRRLTLDEIKERVRTVDLVESITGPLKGPDAQDRYIGTCPFHEDSTPSLRVMGDGGYLCFACGAKGGSVIDFVAMHRGIGTKEAIKALRDEAGDLTAERPAPRPKPEPPPAFVGLPIDAELEARVRAEGSLDLYKPGEDGPPETVRPAAIYSYRPAMGAPASCLVLRIERGGKKLFRPAQWDGARWISAAPPPPRPLYGLERLEHASQVVVVEGEKAADAATARMPSAVAVVTWMGGASSHQTADWQPLAGRPVFVWPDADPPGEKAAQAILARLATMGCTLKAISTEGLPDRFDAADLAADESMVAWIRGRARAWTPPVEPEPEPPAEEPAPPEPPAPPPGVEVQQARSDEFPFSILGQHGDRVFFLKAADGRIQHHGITSLTRREVLGALAPPHVWLRAFGGLEADGRPIGWPTIGMAAQAHIVAACERMPSFDPDSVRGRGCWMHRGRVAFSRGDWVQIDGQRQPGNLVEGVIYESLPPLAMSIGDELSDDEGKRLLALLKSCSWDDPSSADALAGWIAIASICGAIPWRPHVWITGPSGSGKSTIMDEIVAPAVGRQLGIRVAGNTTEAGLRQAIGRDARPVLLDEAEPDAKSMRGILDLARSASTGDTVVRGTPGGGAQFFHIRSTFALSAIDPAISRRADESRITRLSLHTRNDPGADAHFRQLREDVANLITEDFGARLAARSIALAQTTIANIRTIEDAIAARFGSRRLAQQWGALFAGRWSLVSRDRLTTDQARNIAARVPAETASEHVNGSDAVSMLQHMCSYQVDAPGKSGRTRFTIAELIERCVSKVYSAEHEVGRTDAKETLGRWGIRVEADGVFVASAYSPLRAQVFRDTNWQHSYSARLRDLHGAAAGGQLRFAGTRCSSTRVPLMHFTERGDDEAARESDAGSDQVEASGSF